MPKAPPRRPDPVTEKAILELLRAGNTRKVAANANDVSEATLKQWLNRIPSFRTAVEKAEAQAEMLMVQTIFDNAAQFNRWQPALNWLSRRKPMEWGEIQRFEVYQRIQEIQDLQSELAGEGIHVPMQQLISDYQRMVESKKTSKGKQALRALPQPGTTAQ